MIEIIATPKSVEHAQELIDLGVNTLLIGEDRFGLRLPCDFSREEQAKIIQLGKDNKVKVLISLNAMFHNEDIEAVKEYIPFLYELNVDAILLGDPGVVQTMRNLKMEMPYIFDAQVMTTTSRQINFWAKRGAIGGVVAREVPLEELKVVAKNSIVPVEILVYGTTCIHQSLRPLVENYLHFIEHPGKEVDRDKPLYLSEPMKKNTQYPIYEDCNGTHIFANNDLNLMEQVDELYDIGLYTWKLDGLFIPKETYDQVIQLFIQAKEAILDGTWTKELGHSLSLKVRELHPKHRGLDTGFLNIDPKSII